MKLLFSSYWAMTCLWIFSAKAEAPKLIVAILVDQLPYEYLERFHDEFTTNGFRIFTERGVFMTTARYDYFPTVTAPGHASVFSGSAPCGHGIIANEWFDKRTRRVVYCVEDPSASGVGTTTTEGDVSPRNLVGATFADQLRLRYRSRVVGISMKDRGAILPAGKKPAGAFWFELKSGRFVTSTYYMRELPEWVKQFNERKRVAEFAGATWNRLLDPKFYIYPDVGAGEGRLSGETNSTFPHTVILSKETGYEHIMPTPYGNELLAEFARAAIEGEKLGEGPQPDLLCVSFSSIDSCGHRFGPYSQEVQDITLRLDRQLNEFFNYLDQKIGLDHVAMILTADHGVAPNPEFATQQGMDGQRLNESEWMVELMGKLDERFGSGKYFLSPKTYGGNLYFNHDTLQEKSLSPAEVSAFIREWALSSGKVQACYSREQLLDGRAPGLSGQLVLNGYHAERGGDVVLALKPFVIPSSSKTGTTHGSPYSYDTHVPVLFYGSAFKAGRYADEFYISDIAPTLCASLRMDVPPGCMGKPFLKALVRP
ncbi:MAG TPA: alkaline phosphatase family protein [Verrucomicrobiae bacterium]|nr:alkaline phosphatase family protein [Verrucomicrobiae bacterium]